MRLSVIITPQNQQYRVDNWIMSSNNANNVLECSKPDGGFKAWLIVIISFLIFMIEVKLKK